MAEKVGVICIPFFRIQGCRKPSAAAERGEETDRNQRPNPLNLQPAGDSSDMLDLLSPPPFILKAVSAKDIPFQLRLSWYVKTKEALPFFPPPPPERVYTLAALLQFIRQTNLRDSYQTGSALTASSNHRMYKQKSPTIKAWTVDTSLGKWHTHTHTHVESTQPQRVPSTQRGTFSLSG